MDHTGLVATFAKRYFPLCDRASDMDDLMQAGHIGVMLAEATWNADKGAFSTWAAFYIQREMQDAIGLRGTKSKAQREAVSLDAPLGEDEEGTLQDVIPAQQDDPERECLERDGRFHVARVVRECVRSLPGKQADAILAVDLDGVSLEQAQTALATDAASLSRYRHTGKRKLRSNARMRKLAQELELGIDTKREKCYNTLVGWPFGYGGTF